MKTAFLLVLGTLVLYLALVLPNHPGTMKPASFVRWPLELPVIILMMLAFGQRRGVPFLFAIVLLATTYIKLADYGMFIAYNRTFNPILDTFLIKAGIGLLSDSVGRPLAYIAIATSIVALILWFFALLSSLRCWARFDLPVSLRGAAVVGTIAFGSWAVADAGHHLDYWKFKKSPTGTAWTSRLAFKRGVEMRATAVDLANFRKAAQQDQYADATGLLDRLDGRDVILIWIESYGRASFDNDLYSPTHLATLSAADILIRDAGFDIKSGWLASPTTGGQSWLAHGSLASGLWTSDHGRYNAMIASGKKWLFHFAKDAGYRTSAIMPAITLGWPESSAMGFELIFPAADIPYKGVRFNWVTMPDQFTLATYADLLPDDPRPDFIQIALISSHAPWVPVLDMVPWEAVGDGTIFNEMAARGPTPRELWKDNDNVREAYRKAVDYSLRATFEHVAQLGDKAPLIIVAGDHQAAGFVAGSDNIDVPVHMIGPPKVLELINHWNWNDGLIPADDGPVRRMDSFRDDFIEAFSTASKLAEVSQ